MYRKFVNARSPMRLLEKGLHGGLGIGNLGACVAGPGVGKTSFLVCVALDELLRGGTVIHIALGQSVGHVRDHYDAIYSSLARETHLDDALLTRTELDQNRRIHSFWPRNFNASKLVHVTELEAEVGGRPTLLVIDGLAPGEISLDDFLAIQDLARTWAVEVWFSFDSKDERVKGLPAEYAGLEGIMSVVLALEPRGDEVTLRALKDHDNEDVLKLHVGLDPRTLLLVRN
ncbi:MAG: hypothetical protein ACJZ7Z_12195 [Myxococcota bacterium]|nr:MAG: hypothetical protein CBC32_005340 [Proteobacteria bacterium TMED72]